MNYYIWVTCVTHQGSYLHLNKQSLDWLRPRITYEILHDWLHPRTAYMTDYVWASCFTRIFPSQTTGLISHVRYYASVISGIETYHVWLHPRITCKILQDLLHPRKTYRTNYVWENYYLHQDFMLRQPVSLSMVEHITPSFKGSHSGSHQVFL